MVSVNTRWDQLRNHMVSAGIVAVIAATVWLAMSFGKLSMLGVVGLVGLIVAVYVGVRHPLWLFWALAAVMAVLQYGRIPGAHLPLYLPLAFGCLLASILHPRFARSPHPLELAVLALIITSGLSVVANYQSLADVSIFVRWLIAMSMIFPLLQLSQQHLATFGRIFVCGAALNGIFGFYLIAFDQNHASFRYLRAFGYLEQYTVGFYAYTNEGASRTQRLGGTWVEPNGAGLNLMVALALCILLFAGWRRVVLTTVITAALALTLSRQSIGTFVVGIVLVLIFHTMRSRDRIATIASLGLIAGLCFLISPVRRRILSSFRSDDAGSTSRLDALHNFPGQMSGNWLFGHGWGRREFLDPSYSYTLNLVSNAPLITVYRGGIITGLAFLAVMIVGCVMAYRAIISNSLPWALYGGVFIAFCFVGMQLDHGTADIAQIVLLYSIMLAFLVYIDRERREALRRKSTQTDAVSTPQEAPRVGVP
ncbi:O-antigen ligase family protein [Mycobacterium sp.]|uniref:O-antigen ligase family protein n=1 Tax=Mycobacterium sp. TaxID=1785 RepID=UPI0039C9C519